MMTLMHWNVTSHNPSPNIATFKGLVVPKELYCPPSTPINEHKIHFLIKCGITSKHNISRMGVT
jgi:hypothetical protein